MGPGDGRALGGAQQPTLRSSSEARHAQEMGIEIKQIH